MPRWKCQNARSRLGRRRRRWPRLERAFTRRPYMFWDDEAETRWTSASQTSRSLGPTSPRHLASSTCLRVSRQWQCDTSNGGSTVRLLAGGKQLVFSLFWMSAVFCIWLRNAISCSQWLWERTSSLLNRIKLGTCSSPAMIFRWMSAG